MAGERGDGPGGGRPPSGRRDRPSRFLDGPLPVAFAHRGGAGMPVNSGVENTLAAFGRAVSLGCRHLETDVHATSDGVAVLAHDDVLDRLTDGAATGPLALRSWAELSTLRVGGREPFARLDELLDAFPQALVNIDVKGDEAVGPVLSALRRTDAADRVGVAAFSPRRAARLRRALGPDVAVSATPPEVLRWLAGAQLVRPPADPSRRGPAAGRARGPGVLGSTGPTYQVPVSARGIPVVTAASVAAAHRAHRQVHVWTVDDAAEIGALLDLSVDGIVTDRPDVLRGVLLARGEWHG